ncbi:7125_t:CDS:2, partial [Dentiscutata erythropus]
SAFATFWGSSNPTSTSSGFKVSTSTPLGIKSSSNTTSLL